MGNPTLKITVKDQEKFYDSDTTIQTGDAWWSQEGDLMPGHTLGVYLKTKKINAQEAAYADAITASCIILDESCSNVTDQYDITTDLGDLTINKASATLTAKKESKMYDGIALDNSKSTANATGLKGSDYLDEVTFIPASITDVGVVGNTISTYKFNNSDRTEEVTNNYDTTLVNGTLTVSKRDVMLTSNSASKVYDGTPLTGGTVTEGGSKFVTGQGATYTMTGSQTEVGSSDNTFTYSLKEGTNENNYDITTVNGKLTVTERPITITINTASWIYDGTSEKTLKDTDYTISGDGLAVGDTLTLTVDTNNADAGVYSFYAYSLSIKNAKGEDVKDCYSVSLEKPKYITIMKRQATLTADSHTKKYDGTALTDDGFTATNMVDGEAVTCTVVGSQTEVGSSGNVITDIAAVGETRLANYEFKCEAGTLTVEEQPQYLVVVEDKTIAVDQTYESIAFEANTDLTINSNVTTGVLAMNGDNAVVVDGSFAVTALRVSNGANAIVGTDVEIGAVSMEEGAELAISKDLYDDLLANTVFAPNGKLIVSHSEGNALTPDDINAVFAKENVNNVEFGQDLIDINQVTFNAGKQMTIGFEDAYGTAKSDTIKFAKQSDFTIGAQGKVIDLQAGNNKVVVNKNANAAIKSDLVNVSTVKSATGSVVEMADIDFQLGRNATLKAEGATFQAGNINGTDKKTTISIAKNTVATFGDIALGAKSDKIATGKSSSFTAGKVSSADTITLGKYSQSNIGAIDGVKKLSVEYGSKNGGRASLTAGAITATAKADAIYVGQYDDAEIASIDFGAGNDGLYIRSYATAKIDSVNFGADKDTLKFSDNATATINSIDFGDGKDKLQIGKNCELYLDGTWSGTLDISIGKGSDLHLAGDLYNAVTDQFADEIAKGKITVSKWDKLA